jgi:hypothetical protein
MNMRRHNVAEDSERFFEGVLRIGISSFFAFFVRIQLNRGGKICVRAISCRFKVGFMHMAGRISVSIVSDYCRLEILKYLKFDTARHGLILL